MFLTFGAKSGQHLLGSGPTLTSRPEHALNAKETPGCITMKMRAGRAGYFSDRTSTDRQDCWMMSEVVFGADGLARCPWGASTPEYRLYHDHEWGRPVGDENRIYEKLCLEGFQSGLSWLTILRKRDGFRKA